MFFSIAPVFVAALSVFSSVHAAPATLAARQANSGDATFYDVGLGACGVTNVDSEFIVAVSHSLFDTFPGATANPNANPVCGKTITATYPPTGASVTVKVEDRCTGCAFNDLDLSPSAFTALVGGLGAGRVPITWTWN